jgi:hypothetical protein
MTRPNATPDPDDEPTVGPVSRLQRRRDKIVAEIEANRRGEYTVPTWVLALVLAALLAGWAAIIFLG